MCSGRNTWGTDSMRETVGLTDLSAWSSLDADSVLAGVVFSATVATAQSVPAAIFTDPPADAAHPAAMTVLTFRVTGADQWRRVQPIRSRAASDAGDLPRACRE